MARKKKVHWTKLPRGKLVNMIKRLELQCAKLKTQLAEARETKLLNESLAHPARKLIINNSDQVMTVAGKTVEPGGSVTVPTGVQMDETFERIAAADIRITQRDLNLPADVAVDAVTGAVRMAFPWEKE